jgi:TRAP-type C4-dicarboxylate transport system permease small subunit
VNIIRKISDTIYKAECILAILLVFTLLFSIVAGVVFRFVVNEPLHWSDEVAIFSVVWITFVGGSMGIKSREASSITFAMDRLTGFKRQVLLGIGLAVVVVFTGYLLFVSASWIKDPQILMERSSSTGIPMVYPYLCIPIGFACMTIHTLAQLFTIFKADESETTTLKVNESESL